jgi:hypothetical protein
MQQGVFFSDNLYQYVSNTLQRKSHLCILFWELRDLSPNFHIHVSVSDIPGSVHIFPAAEEADRSWEYINRSQKQECGNWDSGRRTIPFLGIFVSNFWYWFFAVCNIT